MKKNHRIWVSSLLLLGSMSFPSGAWAHPTDAEKGLAKQAFDAAKKLVKAKKYAEACPQFAESYRLDPRTGTELNLADCYEHIEKYASAWRHFEDARDKDSRDGDTKRAEFAKRRAENIKSKVPEIVLEFPRELPSLEGFVVEINGQRIESRHIIDSPPAPVALDPGKHVVEIRAKGCIARKEIVELSVGQHGTLRVDALEKIPPSIAVIDPVRERFPVTPGISAKPKDDKQQASNAEDSRPQPTASVRSKERIVAAVGLGMLGIGGVATSIISFSAAGDNWETAKKNCDAQNPNWCPPAAREAGKPFQEKASWQANLATASAVVGGVALAGSAMLMIWPEKRMEKTQARNMISPYASPSGVGVLVIGGF